jgi:hypothetical protein
MWFRKKRENVQPQTDQKLFALLQGQIMGLYVVLGAVIDRLPKPERDSLLELLRAAVGSGFGGHGDFLDEKHRQGYNNAMSAIIQKIIEGSKHSD